MKQFRPGWFVVFALLALGSPSYAAVIDAAVSGVVRDAHGTPQMGALVELLTADATPVASTLTDTHGRYLLPSVNPGKYELRASAAFFVPVHRANLSLRAGAQAIVNLTMSTLFEAANWLPAEQRAADEPADDWKWTLRSAASRPLLRLQDPEDGLAISTSATEVHHPATQARVTVVNGDGAFGSGGIHQVLATDRVEEDGSGEIFRVDVGDPQSPLAIAPSVDVLAGYQRQTMMGGRTRLVAGYASHPELLANGIPSFEVLRMASTQEFSLGDAVVIDAGTLLAAERLEAMRLTSEPFVRVTVRPDDGLAIEYRYATGRQLQSSRDLDRLKPEVIVLTDRAGRPLSDRGQHHELTVSRRLSDDDAISVSVYHDQFDHGSLQGSGGVDAATTQAAAIVSDPTTATFRMATAGYTGKGANVTLTHRFSPNMQGTAQYALGSALRATEFGGAVNMLETRARSESAASVGVHGRILRTGTSVNAQYRWQPNGTLTQVDAYDATEEQAYLSFAVRQKIWGGRWLPHGMDAVVEATNLLEQGYQPVLAPDGHTLFLAQVPRAIQGGLSFNF